jgi:hypothetical protein
MGIFLVSSNKKDRLGRAGKEFLTGLAQLKTKLS